MNLANYAVSDLTAQLFSDEVTMILSQLRIALSVVGKMVLIVIHVSFYSNLISLKVIKRDK